jgi:hypothetical protein
MYKGLGVGAKVSFSFSSKKTKYKRNKISSFGREKINPIKRKQRNNEAVQGSCKENTHFSNIVNSNLSVHSPNKRNRSNYGNQSKSTFTSPNKQTSSDKQKFTPGSIMAGKMMGDLPSPILTGVPSQMDEKNFEFFKSEISKCLPQQNIGMYVMDCKGSRASGSRHENYSSGPLETSDLDLSLNLESPNFYVPFIMTLDSCGIKKRKNAELHYDQYLLDPTNPFHLKPLKELGFDQANIDKLSPLLQVRGKDLLVKWSIMINIPTTPIECVTESSFWHYISLATSAIVIAVSPNLQPSLDTVEVIREMNKVPGSQIRVLTAQRISAMKAAVVLRNVTNTLDASDESDPKGKLNFNQI